MRLRASAFSTRERIGIVTGMAPGSMCTMSEVHFSSTCSGDWSIL